MAVDDVVPGDPVGTGGGFAQFNAALEEFDFRNRAVAVRSAGAEGEVGARGEGGIVWWVGNAHARRHVRTAQFEVKGDVAAVGGGLVNFDSEEVRAVDQGAARQGRREISLFIRAADNAACVSRVTDRAGGQVVAADFGAIEVNHRAVIAQEIQRECGERRGIRDGK